MTVADIRELRSTPLRQLEQEYWSRGIPALPVEVKPRRPGAKPVEEMTAQEIWDTRNDELPSSSRLCYEETGMGVLSLDKTKDLGDGESGTLAEIVADDHWLRDAYPEAFDEDADPALAAHVYDLWLGNEAMTKRYGNAVTPHTHISPEIRSRIEWERFMAQCSDASREGIRRNADGTYGFFSLVGRRLTGPEFQERKAAFAKQFVTDNGLDRFPSAAQIDERNRMRRHPTVQAQIRQLGRIGDAVNKALLALENERTRAMDTDAEAMRQEVETPYIPELATFIFRVRTRLAATRPEYDSPGYRAWLDSTRDIATKEHGEWVEANASDDPTLALRGRHSVGPDALWHTEAWLQSGIDWVRKSTAANVAIGHHPYRDHA